MFLQPKTTWQGTVSQSFPFEFHITSVKSSQREFEGSVVWPTLENTKTKMRGKILSSNKFEYEEYEISEGDSVEVPVTYRGTIKQASDHQKNTNRFVGVGTFEGNEEMLKGTFEIDFSKPKDTNNNNNNNNNNNK
jgi:hypothetical protein